MSWSDRLSVSEIFGPTIQGEGIFAGRTAIFLRLGNCNLACTWCDTKYTWDWENYDKQVELTQRSVRDIRNEIVNKAHQIPQCQMLVITGGEPMLQAPQLVSLLQMVGHMFAWVQFETNGTIAPPADITNMTNVHFVASPKLANSGTNHKMSRELHPYYLISSKTTFKFVCEGVDDFDEIRRIVRDNKNVWIMPQGTTKEELVNDRVTRLAEAAITEGWNFTNRLHTLLWGSKRAH